MLPLVEIDSANSARGNFNGNTPATPIGPFLFQGALYHVLYTYLSAPPFTTEILKSLDGGQTWAVLDALNEPQTYGGAGYFDLANSRLVFFYADPVAFIFQIQIFDLLTGTWGLAFAGGGVAPANVQNVFGAYLRPDGTRAVLYQDSATGVISCAVLNAANAWVTSFPVNTNAPPGFTMDGFAVMDSTGRVHVVFAAQGFPQPQCYQAIEPNNALGQFNTLGPGFNSLYFGTPAVVGNSIVVPTIQGPFPGPPPSFNPVAGTVWIGTPLNAPVWAESDSIFPNADGQSLVQNPLGTSAPVLFLDTTSQVLYALAVLSNPVGGVFSYILQLSKTVSLGNPAIGWNDSTIYTTPATSTSPTYQTLICLTLGGAKGRLYIAFDANDAAGFAGNEVAFFFPFPPTAIVIGGSPGGGGAAYRPPTCERCCPPLLAELVPWKRPKRALELDAPPPGSKHVAAGGALPAPATNAQTLIVQYQVPNGFRFRLKGLLLGCNCPGWTPGDGNAVFSVSLNKPVGSLNAQGAPVRGFENVSVPLGSFAFGPWPIPEDERSLFESRDVVRVLVSSNPLVIAPGLPNVFTAVLVGHIWPLNSELASAML